MTAIKPHESSDESSSEESSSEESSSDDGTEEEKDTKQSILLKNIKKEETSSSESSDSSDSDSESSDSSDEPPPPRKKNNFKPIPVKAEPISDIEADTPFKKPPANYRRSLTFNQKTATPDKHLKRQRTSSISEQLDSLLDEVRSTKLGNDKRKSLPAKKTKSMDDSMDIGDLSTLAFQSPALSSTMKPGSKLKRHTLDLKSPSKIKKEPESDDELAKKKKNGKSDKRLNSLQKELFNNYLKF